VEYSSPKKVFFFQKIFFFIFCRRPHHFFNNLFIFLPNDLKYAKGESSILVLWIKFKKMKKKIYLGPKSMVTKLFFRFWVFFLVFCIPQPNGVTWPLKILAFHFLMATNYVVKISGLWLQNYRFRNLIKFTVGVFSAFWIFSKFPFFGIFCHI